MSDRKTKGYAKRKTKLTNKKGYKRSLFLLFFISHRGKNYTVYVLRDGVAWLCHVTPLLQEDGCLLLAPSTGENALREGDAVILSERQLFHGKVLE